MCAAQEARGCPLGVVWYPTAAGSLMILLRSAARRDARAARLGKPHELSARDGARIVVGKGARDKVYCDFVMDACGQDLKGGAPVQ